MLLTDIGAMIRPATTTTTTPDTTRPPVPTPALSRALVAEASQHAVGLAGAEVQPTIRQRTTASPQKLPPRRQRIICPPVRVHLADRSQRLARLRVTVSRQPGGGGARKGCILSGLTRMCACRWDGRPIEWQGHPLSMWVCMSTRVGPTAVTAWRRLTPRERDHTKQKKTDPPTAC
jgi:hypothetical protein